ncbi:hypothetical protein [Xanthomonas arboricola]|uniref:AbiU2 domain-containing protein n=1 Tax=Xanthomonas arboricola TaxID=56448 RepID=UPI000E1E5D14|nr:hypothetical protein [Xanthomonas arboricola]
MGKKIELEDFSIRLCSVIVNARYHWRYFYAMLDFPASHDKQFLIRWHRFYTATKQAHCVAAIVGLYTALDGSKANYLTLRNFAGAVAEAGHHELAAEIRDFFDEHAKAIRSVELLRHQWAAHRTTSCNEKQSFELAKMSPERVGDMVEALSAIYVRIAAIGGKVVRELPANSECEVRDVFNSAHAYHFEQLDDVVDKLHIEMP